MGMDRVYFWFFWIVSNMESWSQLTKHDIEWAEGMQLTIANHVDILMCLIWRWIDIYNWNPTWLRVIWILTWGRLTQTFTLRWGTFSTAKLDTLDVAAANWRVSSLAVFRIHAHDILSRRILRDPALQDESENLPEEFFYNGTVGTGNSLLGAPWDGRMAGPSSLICWFCDVFCFPEWGKSTTWRIYRILGIIRCFFWVPSANPSHRQWIRIVLIFQIACWILIFRGV